MGFDPELADELTDDGAWAALYEAGRIERDPDTGFDMNVREVSRLWKQLATEERAPKRRGAQLGGQQTAQVASVKMRIQVDIKAPGEKAKAIREKERARHERKCAREEAGLAAENSSSEDEPDEEWHCDV